MYSWRGVVVQSHWRHWPGAFPQHGPGPKHLRDVSLQPWQEHVVRGHGAALLRGLFHSDGSRFVNSVRRQGRTYTCPRWQFTNHSEQIIEVCTAALDRADVAWRRSGRATVSVSRREAVLSLDALVGLKR